MGSVSIEVRVGAFVLLALALLVGFVLVLGDFSLMPRQTLYGDFAYAGGLQSGAPVKVSGIRVGRVTGLQLLDATARPPPASSGPGPGQGQRPIVRATLALDKAARPLLTQGSLLYVGMQGVIGEAFIEVEPGPVDAEPLADGVSLRGVDAPRLHVLAQELVTFAQTLSALTGTSDGRLGPLAEALTAFFGSVGGVVQDRRGEIGQTLTQLAAITADMQVITAEVRSAVGNGASLSALLSDTSASAATLRRDLPGILERTSRSVQAVEVLATRLSSASDDQRVEEIATELRRTLDNLEATSLDARRVMDTIRRGQGTIGGLVTDPQIYEDTKEMLRDLKRNPWKLLWRD